MFKAKVRNVGTSFGILIPKEVIAEGKIKEGEEIKVSIFKNDPQRLKLLEKAFGSARGAGKFKRDRKDRF